MLIQKIRKEDTWKIRHQVMWPDKDLDYVKLKDDSLGLHYGVFVKTELVSVISLFIDKDKAQFRKFATLVKYQGKGYGSRLLGYVLDEVVSKGVKTIWCNARKNKTSFYKTFGLVETDTVFEKDGLTYVVMEKNIDKHILVNYGETAIFIEELIKSACKEILFNKNIQLDVREKGEQDIVTAKDIAMEKYIVSNILEKFPSHKIIGEESHHQELTDEYTWILDPIDGTLNFTLGNPFYGVQVCLLKNKEEILSAIYLPAIDEFYLAIKNQGLFLNGRKVELDKNIKIENAIISFGDFSKSNPKSRRIQGKLIEKLNDKANKIRIAGSSSVDFSFVASGKTHAHIMFSKRLWEISPGILLAKEAGLIVEVVKVDNVDFRGNVVVTALNKVVFDTVIKYMFK